MKLGKRYGIVAAMEELEEQVAVEETPIVDETESADSAIIESNEIATDIENTDEAIDEAVESSDDLESIADTVEEAGELDETSAAITEVAVESLYRRLCITRVKPMPALESFGSTSNRKKATKVAVENIREVVGKAWEAVKKFFSELIEKIKIFIKGLFDVGIRLKARAESIKKLVDKATGGRRTGAETVASGPWVQNLVNEKNDLTNVAVNVQGMVAVITDVTENTNGLAAFSNKIGAILNKPVDESSIAAVGSAINKIIQVNGVLKNFVPATGAGVVVGSGMKTLMYKKTMIGNKRLFIDVPEKLLNVKDTDFDKDLEQLSKVSCKMIDGAGAKKDLDKITTLELSEITAVANAVIKTVEAVDDSKSIIDSLENMRKVFAKEGEGKEETIRKDVFKTVVAAMRASGKLGATPVFAVDKHAINVCKSALDYCNLSLKSYVGPSAAPEAAAAPAEAK